MATRLLIDAAHPEETRVVVVSGTRLDEFDFESSSRRQLKGNIYLAKVVRVEPSLQAAFVEYGGNRHGFLAFGDIHPDYYQIRPEDRQALVQERAAEEAARGRAEDEAADAAGDPPDAPEPTGPDVEGGDSAANDAAEASPAEPPQQVGGDDIEDAPAPERRDTRRYKIQDVIKRRQVLLVQVSKEERGTKGAALTTYLSLAGRYCVLMPNTARGGGISRKISDVKDRKRLRQVIESLEVPDGVGLIVRTAGLERTKADIRRDYDYLLRVWESVRDLALRSTAPTPVYEEANLIKRAIRDLYSSDLTEVLVEGAEAYKAAKGTMKMLMPSHAKRVQKYDDRVPLFHRYQVEQQLDLMHSPTVELRSGGYIVFNSTEALVAVDVNSGRSTRERNIEETALKTNLEAAEEVARQLRLRDLAGLIVIDFIDMEVARNNRAVERKLKEVLKGDRARIQMGGISSFGLLELSRQRLRPSLLETSTEACTTCGGTGLVRSTESSALHVMRAIEDEGIRGQAVLTVEVPAAVAIYLLNQKREVLVDVERRLGLSVKIVPDPDLVPPDHRIARVDWKPAAAPAAAVPVAGPPADAEEEEEEDDSDRPAVEQSADADGNGDSKAGRRRRGRRGGRKHRRKDGASADSGSEPTVAGEDDAPTVAAPADAEAEPDTATAAAAAPVPEPRRKTQREPSRATAKTPAAAPEEPPAEASPEGNGEDSAAASPGRKTRRRRRRRSSESTAAAIAETAPDPEPQVDAPAESVPATPIAAKNGAAPSEETPSAGNSEAPPEPPAVEVPPAETEKPRRRGWWQFGR